jgi:hypothetical protein
VLVFWGASRKEDEEEEDEEDDDAFPRPILVEVFAATTDDELPATDPLLPEEVEA